MGLVFTLIPLLIFTGIGLGIAGLFEKKRKRISPLIGLIMNAIQLFVLGGLLLMGLLFGS